MLDNIKSLILEKKEFQEDAKMILESSSNNLDDTIILGSDMTFTEDTSYMTEEDEGDDVSDTGNIEEDKEEDKPEEKGDDSESDDGDLMDKQSDDSSDGSNPAVSPSEDQSLIDEPIDDSSIPTPIGAQTGEPVYDDIDDLMKVEIDLKSNTLSDILPIPPSGAIDAIGSEDDDIMSQTIDSGFGGEEADTDDAGNDMSGGDLSLESKAASMVENLMNNLRNNSSEYTEAISLGGDTGDTTASTDPAPDTLAADNNGENAVTTAVRDKVSEMDSSEPSEADIAFGGDDTGTDDTSSSDGGDSDGSKEAVFKKLSNLTNEIEKTKLALLKGMNNN